ncbi:MAG: chemotaxis protein CheA [Gammaproteobacteria bacterium]|nr:chemotaxis protein CheA [Rhodocyclaceae bacterium]MBU3910475.1 chemotaxis protein CheA [Gammaproteobacteria bacterium]MBU4004956.1 chemotaxis protein CheA [Gammaproteobacteria bacterium]MBU4020549.1 chemotaxis protein CheA [Gammaproteobacteria bacterium]MBU4095625.1 chemotaxis protein CheA [Gammaproteobacteria bacterium]
MEDLLLDFLTEATDLLSDVDNKLVDLEKNPQDHRLLNDIFRGFHTIKGGAGFLNAAELVTLCHLTENLFDKLRNGELALTKELMDSIMAATGTVRDMFGHLDNGVLPPPADANLIANLKAALAGEPVEPVVASMAAVVSAPTLTDALTAGLDWNQLYGAVASVPAASATPAAVPAAGHFIQSAPTSPAVPAMHTQVAGQAPETIIQHAVGRRATDKPGAISAPVGRRDNEKSRDNSIRVDTSRLDQVLNLSGEIGLTKNRLNALRSDILNGRNDTDTLHALDQAVSQLDLLVSDLQNAVMKTRMQPIGRLFQKYPRIARDLARNLGKDVELLLVGEETEIDKTMIEDLSDPIIHLIRNAVDHGVESTQERLAAGKPEKSQVRLEARQEGDHIVLIVADDGKGMNAERLRAKALEKGIITDEEANSMDERQSFNLVFLPGFSTMEVASDVSGRGVGMDVVRTNIQKLNGSIEIKSSPGKGTSFVISLPLTLAILPVLLVQLGEQPFAVPLSMVREILPIQIEQVQEVGGRATMVVRGEVMPIYPICNLLGWTPVQVPEYGVLMQTGDHAFILAIDGFMGREDAVIKSLEDFRPKGVAGVTTLSNGQIVLILDIKELLSDMGENRGVPRSSLIPERREAA